MFDKLTTRAIDKVGRLQRELDEAEAALKPFANLSQDHQSTLHPDVPIFAINGAEITKRDVDRAKAVVSK